MLDECRCLVYNDIRSSDGLSPNGKATDSDSVIFKVRILVAQLKAFRVIGKLFLIFGKNLVVMMRESSFL